MSAPAFKTRRRRPRTFDVVRSTRHLHREQPHMMSHSLEHRIPLSSRQYPASRPYEGAWASVVLVLVIALSTAVYRASVPASPTVGAIREASPAGLVTSF